MIDWAGLSDYEGPEQSPGFRLWKLSALWRRQVETALAQVGLTHPQFVLLSVTSWLTREGAHLKQVELAKYCGMDINVTSQVLRALEKRRYITRNQEDGRSKSLVVTPEGQRQIERALPIVEAIDSEFFAPS